MSTRIELWGKNGKIIADRQEVHIYLNSMASAPDATYNAGWTLLNNLSLKDPVDFYLRGEEYSIQIEHFIACIENRAINTRSTFYSAHNTDVVAEMMNVDAAASDTRDSNRNSISVKNKGSNWIRTVKEAISADLTAKSQK